MLSGLRLIRKATPLAKKFAAIGNPIRLSILFLLKEEPTEMGDIVDRLNLPASLVAHHLKLLLDEGLVTKTVFGKTVTYYINQDAFSDVEKFISVAV